MMEIWTCHIDISFYCFDHLSTNVRQHLQAHRSLAKWPSQQENIKALTCLEYDIPNQGLGK